MRTIKCASIVAGIIALLTFGIIIVDWVILIFVVPLLFLLFISMITFYNEPVNVEIKRELTNEKIFEKDTAEITLKIKNLGETINFLEIYDELPKKVKVTKGSNLTVLNLKKNEEIELKYQIYCPIRGRFSLGPCCVRVKDFFDLFYDDTKIDNISDLTVIPKIEEIRNIPVKSKSNMFPGMMNVKNSGIGTEFYGIRNYTTGDTFKNINWKSFARSKNLMVNEFELESTTDVILIIDARDTQMTGTIKNNPLEHGVKAAVSIASHFLKKRDRVGLIAYGSSDGGLTWVYPESGKNQLYKIIEEIVSLQANGEFKFNGVVERSITHMLPKKSMIFFISSLDDDSTIPKAINQLIAFGYNICVLSLSSIKIENSLLIEDNNCMLAHRILSFERENFLTELRNTGATVVEWDLETPLAVTLEEVGKYQIKR